MGFFPSLGYLELIDGAIQEGKGVEGAVDGQTYNVYRLTSQNNSILDGSPLYTEYPAKIRHFTMRQGLENVIFELLAFEFQCDARFLNIGDLLVETGYGSDGGQYVLAQKRPTEENLFMRVERNVNITRPLPLGGSSAQQPISGSIVASNYIGITKGNEEFLTLTNGMYSFQITGSMAAVPFGLQPQNRIRSKHKPDFPTQVPEVQFAGYLPYLNGIQIIENDIINSANGDRYVVVQVFQSDDVGLQGYIVALHKAAV